MPIYEAVATCSVGHILKEEGYSTTIFANNPENAKVSAQGVLFNTDFNYDRGCPRRTWVTRGGKRRNGITSC